jgi:hypothetical protein
MHDRLAAAARIMIETGLLAAALIGCQQPDLTLRDAPEATLFAPDAMRIHPIFTQYKDFNADGQSDGLEALLEFTDRFGDPTKSAGGVIFELFEFRQASPDPRGDRLAEWRAPLLTVAEQRRHWDRTSRAYSFPLSFPQLQPGRTYVLSAMFQRTSGEPRRFFDRIILEAQAQESTRAPSPQPLRFISTAQSSGSGQP